MSRFRTLIALICLSFSGNFLFAQSSADNNNTFVAKGFSLTEIVDQDWSIYSDEENNIYYIDFEKITFNLSEIVVLDQDGQEIFKEEVFDLPVNTIYELDFKPFGTGDYRIELRSFTGFIKKEVSVK